MPNLFDDIVNTPQPGAFDDILGAPAPSFGNVQGGASASPSFAGVQAGSTSVSPGEATTSSDYIGAAANQVADLGQSAYIGLKKGSEELGRYGGLAIGGAAGLFDDIVGTNTQDSVFKSLVEPYDVAAKASAAELAKKNTAGQIVGGITNAVPDLVLGAASMGETAAPKLAAGLYEALTATVATGAKMAAPLAEKAAGDAYGQAIADGKAPWDAATDALKAIGSTEAMGVLGGAAEGKLLSRVAQSSAAAGGTSEALRMLQGGEFNPVELGTNLAIGGAFGVAGHEGTATHTPTEVRPGDTVSVHQDDFQNPIRDSETANVSPEGFQAEPGKTSAVDEMGNSVPAKTESKISPQQAREADTAAEQNKAWGLFDDIVAPKQEAATSEPHPLFDDLVPRAHVEEAAPPKEPEIGSWQYNLDLGRQERMYTPEDTKRALERSNTPEPIMREFHEGTLTSGKLLDNLANDTSGRVEPETRTLAKYLQAASKRFGGDNVKITRYNPENPIHAAEKVPEEKVQGYYHPIPHAIRLTRDAPTQHLMLHETVHGLTTRALVRGERNELGGQAQHAFNGLQSIFEGVKNHLDFIGDFHKVSGLEGEMRDQGATRKEIYEQAQYNPDASKQRQHYGFTNLHEFLAEFYAQPKFREILKGIPLDKVSAKTAGVAGRLAFGKIRNVYEATVRGIRQILGLPEKAETALDATFAVAHQFLGNLTPEHLGNVDKYAYAPEMAGTSREQIDAQAKAAIAKGANPEAVQKRVDALYREHGHDIEQGRGSGPAPTSTKNTVRDAERAAEGRDPILKAAVQSNPETLSKAQEAIAANPHRPAEVINKLNEDGVHSISATDEAVLLVEKVRLRNARDQAAETMSDPHASEEAKSAAQVAWTEHEAAINTLDQATTASGQEWGRLGQFRQQMLKADYTFDSMERRARAAKKGPLTPEESAQVKSDHEAIQKAQKEADKAQDALSDKTRVKETYDALVQDMAKQLKGAAKKGTFLETLKKNADESRNWFKANLSRSSAGVDPVAFFHLARIGAYHIANGAIKFKDWLVKMKSELGDHFSKVEDSMPAVFKAATEQHKFGATETKPRLKAKAALDPNNITHKDVYDLARAHILNGVHGEDAVMAAVHGDLKQHGLSERDVRRLFSEYGEVKFPSKAADKKELRELRSLTQMQESIDRLQEGLSALKSGPQRDKPTAEIREKRRKLNDLLKAQEAKSGLSPEKLATYQDIRARNVENQIEDLNREIATGEKKVRPTAPPDNERVTSLKAERDRLKAELKKIQDAKNPPKSPEEKYQDTRAKSIKQQMDKIYERIQAGDYAKRTRPDHDLNKANTEAHYKLYQAKNLFARHAFEMQMAQRSPLGKLFGGIREGLNLSRAVMTSVDLSATLRQGGFIVMGHPIRGMKALATSIGAARSEKAAYAVQRQIETRPNFALYQKAGLDLTLSSGHALGKQEEQFMSRLVEHSDYKHNQPIRNAGRLVKNVVLAPVRGSERIFKTFINKLRADSFDTMLAGLAKDGHKPTKEELKAIANYINVATGRGKVGPDNRYAGKLLSDAFFAPRLVASRFNLLAGQPLYGGSAKTRTMIAGEYARYLTGVATVVALGALAHAASDHKDEQFIELDPRSSNFGKMKFGNTYIDFMSGLGQVTTFAAREISGQSKTGSGKVVALKDVPFGGSDRFDVATRFARTKLAPIPGVIANLGTGKNVIGQKVTLGQEALDITTPMSLQNVKSIMEEHGVPAGTAITMLDLLGMSVQQRTPTKKQEKPHGN